MTERPIEKHHWNTVFLLSAISTVCMTLVVGIQPLFLDRILEIPFESAGAVNASVQIAAEIGSLLLIGILGYLSDRIGRKPIIVFGFLTTALGAFFMPLSLPLGTVLGLGALTFYYLTRIIMSLGSCAYGPQLWTLAGDYTNAENRTSLVAKTTFMTVFGGTIVYAILMRLPQQGDSGLMILLALPFIVALAGAWLAKHQLVEVAPRLEEEGIPWRRVFKLVASEPKMHLTFATAFYSRSDMVFVSLFVMMWCIYFADLDGLTREQAAAQAGTLIAFGGATILLSIPVWAAFIRRYGRVASIAVGLSLSGVGFVSLVFIDSPFEGYIYIPTIMIALGQAGCLIAPQILTIELAPKDLMGSVLGFFYFVGGLGIVFLVQAGGFYFDTIGPHAPFMLIGTGNLLISVYGYWLWRAEVRGTSLITADKSGFKPLVFMLCLLPFVWFLGRLFVTHAIPNNDIDNLPVGYQQRYLGDWALYLLIVSLALRPFREMTGVNKIARYSRMLGLFAFFYACLHVVNYVWFEFGFHWVNIWNDIVDRPAITVGIIAFLMLIPLAATSTNEMVRKLGGKRWKALHRTVYIIDLLVILHFVLVTDRHYFLPALMGAAVVMLLGYRLRKSRGYQGHGVRHLFEHWLLEIRPDLSAGGKVHVSTAPPPKPEPTDDYFEIRPILEQMDEDVTPRTKRRRRAPRAPEEATES